MSAFWAIARKTLAESRWLLGLTAAALFGLAWLFLWLTARDEARRREPPANLIAAAMGRTNRGFVRVAQAIGGPSVTESSSGSLAVAFWRHPLMLLILCAWPIARGSGAVAAEVERGSLDLILSRPVSRTTYLAAHAAAALVGMAVLAASLVAGLLLSARWHPVETPPAALAMARPALNVVALGMAIFGYTLLASAVDLVRWRPTLIGSGLTIGGFVLLVMAQIFAQFPSLEHLKTIDRLSIFRAYDPAEALVAARSLPFNAAVLGAVALAGIVPAWLVFVRRDLPANG